MRNDGMYREECEVCLRLYWYISVILAYLLSGFNLICFSQLWRQLLFVCPQVSKAQGTISNVTIVLSYRKSVLMATPSSLFKSLASPAGCWFSNDGLLIISFCLCGEKDAIWSPQSLWDVHGPPCFCLVWFGFCQLLFLPSICLWLKDMQNRWTGDSTLSLLVRLCGHLPRVCPSLLSIHCCPLSVLGQRGG